MAEVLVDQMALYLVHTLFNGTTAATPPPTLSQLAAPGKQNWSDSNSSQSTHSTAAAVATTTAVTMDAVPLAAALAGSLAAALTANSTSTTSSFCDVSVQRLARFFVCLLSYLKLDFCKK
jgi:hypothetical protein